ncbi:hypothetical protein L208DRAFT_1462614 [Tricholoma matsutake]|nr:hypothetical protein L208DRAFT_1462614 [Tricholoma matsutake 945]
MAVIEVSYGGKDGVTITNTGTKVLWLSYGALGFILCANTSTTLSPATDTYKIMASDDYKPTSNDGPAPTTDEESKMTTIAKIDYTSNALISIHGGDTLKGAKFSSEILMVEEEAPYDGSISDSDSDSDGEDAEKRVSKG